MDQIEEIRSHISIESLVSEYVKLKKAGRNLKGLCPFHNEKTPSFIVSPEKGIAYCFACHKGGDIFTFMQLIENIDFKEAIKLLADKAGVKLKSFQSGRKKNLKIQNINEIIAEFYSKKLYESEPAKEYIKTREIAKDSIKKFQIGFAPDSFNETYSYLLEKGFTHKEILDAGLAVSKNITELKIYDRFRNRIVFPITNVQGQIIAFGCRSLDSDIQPKYLNSPDSPSYNKSYVIYGLSHAKESIKKEDRVIIVEGYLDVISSHQIGIKNIVASSGTALTYQQVKLLKRYTKNFYFCFDSDQAGLQATERAIEISIPEEINIKIIEIKNGKDPDECIKTNPGAWIDSVNEAKDIMDFYFEKILCKYDVNSIDGKKSIAKTILPIIKKFPNKIEQNHYLKRLSKYIKTSIEVLQSEIKRINTTQKKEDKIFFKNKSFTIEEYLLGILINHPQKSHIAINNLITNLFIKEKTKNIYKLIEALYNFSGRFERLEDVFSEHSKEEIEFLKILGVFIDQKYQDFSEDNIEKEIMNIIKQINKSNFKLMKEQLINSMKSNNDDSKIILNRYNELLKIKIS